MKTIYYLDKGHSLKMANLDGTYTFEDYSFIMAIMEGTDRIIPEQSTELSELEKLAIGNIFFDENNIKATDFQGPRTITIEGSKYLTNPCCTPNEYKKFLIDYVRVEVDDSQLFDQDIIVTVGWNIPTPRKLRISYDMTILRDDQTLIANTFNAWEMPSGTLEFTNVKNTNWNDLNADNITINFIQILEVDNIVLIVRPKIYTKFVEKII